MKKLQSVSATWTVIGTRERSVTLCVVRASDSPRKGYDIYVGGNWNAGQFGTLALTVPRAPTDMELGLWADKLLRGQTIG